MSKLIYVDRLKKDILALQDCYNGFSDTYDKACIIGVIDEQPTVEERKKGEWNYGDDMFEYAICSVCKWDSGEAWEYAKKYFRYCPHCGADMRGGKGERNEN